jgi:Fic family protein
MFKDGFEGKRTTSKWAKLAKCSQDTAYRDILSLIELGALVKADGGDHSTNYKLAQGKPDRLPSLI